MQSFNFCILWWIVMSTAPKFTFISLGAVLMAGSHTPVGMCIFLPIPLFSVVSFRWVVGFRCGSVLISSDVCFGVFRLSCHVSLRFDWGSLQCMAFCQGFCRVMFLHDLTGFPCSAWRFVRFSVMSYFFPIWLGFLAVHGVLSGFLSCHISFRFDWVSLQCMAFCQVFCHVIFLSDSTGFPCNARRFVRISVMSYFFPIWRGFLAVHGVLSGFLVKVIPSSQLAHKDSCIELSIIEPVCKDFSVVYTCMYCMIIWRSLIVLNTADC